MKHTKGPWMLETLELIADTVTNVDVFLYENRLTETHMKMIKNVITKAKGE